MSLSAKARLQSGALSVAAETKGGGKEPAPPKKKVAKSKTGGSDADEKKETEDAGNDES